MPNSPSRWSSVYLLAILLLAAAVRLPVAAAGFPFHPDEALYATYARKISLFGDFLLADVPVALDKPPLGLILTALGQKLVGESEFGARIPAVWVSLMSVSAVYAIGVRLVRVRAAALFATLIYAVSPFDVAFAGTAFHDPLLTFCLLMVTLQLLRGKFAWAGGLVACAIATKQSAIQFLPIFVALALVGIQPRSLRQHVWRFLTPILLGIGLLALWSALRAAPVDFWTLGITNPGELRLIRSDEVLPRLREWLKLLGYALGALPLWALPFLGIATAFFEDDRPAQAALIAAIGVIGTLMLYWLVAFNPYDRYLHPLIPLIALLSGRGAAWLYTRRARFALPSIILIGTLPFTLMVTQPSTPIGAAGIGNNYRGVDRIAEYLNTLDGQPILFDHWLSWELRYYLGQFTRVRLIWYPTPEQLAREACTFATESYFAMPNTLYTTGRWRYELEQVGVQISEVARTPLILYHLDCP